MTRAWCIICFALPLVACGTDVSGGNQNNESTPECGNALLEAAEVCDGSALNGQTCESLGHLGGILACSDTCQYDHSGCTSSVCGNGVQEETEACDGSDLAGTTCETEGYDGGALYCDGCALDYDECTTCGNSVPEAGEDCDASDLRGETCMSLGFSGGILACDPQCQLATVDCSLCGNDLREDGEQCDGPDLAGLTCGDLGYQGGVLGCDGSCFHDTMSCYSCGNDVAETGEQCDGPDLGGATCTSLGAAPGTLACGSGCTYDLSNCGACDTVDDLINQTGCTGGDACMVTTTSSLACKTPGTVGFYQPCSAWDDCVAGAICATGSGSAECFPFCDLNTGTGCPAGDVCAYQLNTMAGDVGLCMQAVSCDLVNSTGCPPGDACYVFTGAGVSGCFAEGAVGVGGACQYANDCVGGTMCGPTGCTELCYTTADCSVGTCQSVGTVAPGHPTVGICQ